MSKPADDQLQTIDPAALAQVSGGTTTATTSNDVMTALTGILQSIQSLAQPASGGFNQQEMMMLMMMMQQRNEQQAAAAAATTWSWNQEPIVHYY
jgi:hypothetical protein